MNILVFGGAGYIGAHIVHDLFDAGHDVTVFDDLSTGFKQNLPSNVKFYHGSINSLEDLSNVFNEDIDAIFHFSAKKAAGESMIDARDYSNTNIIGTVNILNSMISFNIQNIIFSSSAAVYGDPQYIPIDELHPLKPTNYYGFTKLTIEELLNWYSRIHNFQYASLRYFNAVGYDHNKRISLPEKQPCNLFPRIMEVLNGSRKKLNVYGNDYNTSDGTCIRDYIHVNDLSKAHLNVMEYLESEKKNITVNLGSDKGYSVLQAIQAAESVTNMKVEYDIVNRRDGDPSILFSSSALAKDVLGWTAEKSDLESIFQSMWLLYNKDSINAVY